MNLLRLIPAKALRYFWQEHLGVPQSPTVPTKPRDSRQGWLSIGNPGHEIPNGAEVAGAALDVDGTRGVFGFWIPWGPAVGITFPSVSIAVWKSTEAAPVSWDPANPANELAGRLGLPVAAGDSRSTVATNVAAKILLMLTNLGKLTAFTQLGGAVIPNSALTFLGAGTVAIVSPRLWRRSALVHQTGAFNTTQRIFIVPAVVRPILLAGIRPAPWLIVGQVTEGRGEDQGPVG
jgi:hypothetical protein